MQVVIDIPKEMYKSALSGYLCDSETLVNAIKNGTPLPEGAEILTKEAYSDLCMRASKAESEEP